MQEVSTKGEYGMVAKKSEVDAGTKFLMRGGDRTPAATEEVNIEPRAESEDDLDAALERLREPFPPHMVEKLPKPMFKGAWDGKKGSNCPECHGYHVLDSTIHLSYAGHANVTNRLLDVDKYWAWEPMAYTEHGLPLFDGKGLWIKLTVCGVTRLGYGDGASIKEVIGDAIRNAAMRFGVALDLWSKIDLHAERNPGDGKTPSEEAGHRASGRGRGPREGREGNPAMASSAPPRAANQDALDGLGSICEEHGYPRNEMRPMYILWAADKGRPDTDLLDADAADLLDFGAHLVDLATDDPRGDESAAGDAARGGGEGVGHQDARDGGGDQGRVPTTGGPDGDPADAGPAFDGGRPEDQPPPAEMF